VPDDGQFSRAQKALRRAQEREHLYRSQGNRFHELYNPWMPFQIGEFLSIMSEVVPEMQGPRFLDVGCGPGTKPELAREVFGLDVTGIEVDIRMAQAASTQFPVLNMDALDFGDYGSFDALWLFRPFRDPDLELALEEKVMSQMRSGAILAGGSWEMEKRPPWIPVVDEWEGGLRRGAWMKPGL
jgi:SAM-dependent methyltransferase